MRPPALFYKFVVFPPPDLPVLPRRGITANQAFTAVWYQDGKEISRSEETWRGTESGYSWVMLGNKEGLVAGQYELELSVDGKMVQTGVMMIEGGE